MSSVNVQNALIQSAEIVIDRGVFVTAWLRLDYGSSVQGFGGHALYVKGRKERPFDCAGEFISRVLEVVGVEKWSQIPGNSIRVEIDGGLISGIGHIIKDKWFHPSDHCITEVTPL